MTLPLILCNIFGEFAIYFAYSHKLQVYFTSKIIHCLRGSIIFKEVSYLHIESSRRCYNFKEVVPHHDVTVNKKGISKYTSIAAV